MVPDTIGTMAWNDDPMINSASKEDSDMLLLQWWLVNSLTLSGSVVRCVWRKCLNFQRALVIG
jgi:hypothetical protein